jgi:hypothetical protein
MILGDHTNFKFVSLLSKVDFGKSNYDADNPIHVMVAKAVARHSQE